MYESNRVCILWPFVCLLLYMSRSFAVLTCIPSPAQPVRYLRRLFLTLLCSFAFVMVFRLCFEFYLRWNATRASTHIFDARARPQGMKPATSKSSNVMLRHGWWRHKVEEHVWVMAGHCIYSCFSHIWATVKILPANIKHVCRFWPHQFASL